MTDLRSYAERHAQDCVRSSQIPPDLYGAFGVNLGLRDKNGNGVLTGLTNISKITAFKTVDGTKTPCDGELWYRGYRIEELIRSLGDLEDGFGKVAYLLLTGELPTPEQQAEFAEVLGASRTLPTNFTRDVIMKAPSVDIMNSMTKSILTLGSYDDRMADNSIENVLRQCIQLTAIFPMLAVYAYHAYMHYEQGASMFIHHPDPSLSTAENLLMMLRPDQRYTDTEAKVLDTALILHMEHGGGNNSSFTTRVVTSSGADTYATMAAAMCSLKGPKHGGANIKVMEMMDDIRAHVKDFADREEIAAYLTRLLDKDAFDRQGLIYGMGHAVYSLSDPRERVFRRFVEELAHEKGRENDLLLYQNIEELAPVLIAQKRKIYKGVSPNIDFFSGFVYEMLGIPRELFTATFAIARIVGWSAHRIEELVSASKIIRPAYLSVMQERAWSETD